MQQINCKRVYFSVEIISPISNFDFSIELIRHNGRVICTLTIN